MSNDDTQKRRNKIDIASRPLWRPTLLTRALHGLSSDFQEHRSRLKKTNIDLSEKGVAPMPPQGPFSGVSRPHRTNSLISETILNAHEKPPGPDWMPTPLVRAAKGKPIGDVLAAQRAKLKKTGVDLSHPVNRPFVNPSQVEEPSSRRYIMSPLQHTQNLFDNAYGMALHTQSIDKEIVQPVFMNHMQRISFHKRVQDELSREGLDVAGPFNKKQTEKRTALLALSEMSNLTGGKMSMQGTENSIMYTQSHGFPGKRYVESDDEYLTLEEAKQRKQNNPRVQYSSSPGIDGKYTVFERVTDKQTAHSLLELGVNEKTRLRANSCYSGTEHRLVGGNEKQILKLFHTGQLQKYTGKWDNTYAGGVQQELNRQGKGVRSGVEASSLSSTPPYMVKGYIGPTSQRSVMVHKKGETTMERNFRVQIDYKDNVTKVEGKVPLRRSDSSRTVIPKD